MLPLPELRSIISLLFELIPSSDLSSLAAVTGNWEKEVELDATDEWWEMVSVWFGLGTDHGLGYDTYNTNRSCVMLVMSGILKY